ncbi:MAG: carboxypeptidase regulatory-like domain-containing protein [Acidobacteriaceae bacterium]|nr:carboxypeptidase regulatory-like domain-containing protein [Acidobacteriaceae bacterium]
MRLFRSLGEKLRLVTSSIVFAGLVAVIAGQPLSAQSFTSSIAGIVTDPSGGSIRGARVELQNMATHDVRDFTSQDDGSYRFDNLDPGTYQLTVTAPGFKTYVQQNLVLQAQINSTVHVSLELGNTQQKVEVTAAAVLVDTQTANNVVTMESRLIENLPNATRNPLNFVFALAGTTSPPQNYGGRFQVLDQTTANFGLNGGRSDEEAILIDGAPSQAIDWGGLLVSPLQDSVQEQQVVTNTYDSQYERAGQGIVTLITKGGTPEFHGEAYDYLQNSYLDANFWANNKYGSPRGQYKQNQFGGNIGGPILKRWNLFFFAGYEGLRQPNTQNTGLLSVPTQAERNGDFSQSMLVNGNGVLTPAIIYNPFSTTPVTDASGTIVGYTRTPFAGNKIPGNLINPVGQKIANLYPMPNRAPQVAGTDIGNYYAQGSSNTLSDKTDLRTDWAQSSLHRMFFRFSDRFRQGTTNPCYFCNGADFDTNGTNSGWLAVLNDTITPSPHWVINSLVSYGYWREAYQLVGLGKADASTVGLNPSLFQAPVIPYVTADSYTQLGADLNNADYHYARTTSTAMVNVTKEFEKHTLKFGGNFDVQQISNFKDYPGNFSFSSALTSCDPQAAGPCLATAAGTSSSFSGNAIASELLGTASGGGQGFGISPAMTIHIFGTYIQDQWRITPKLTINAGLRYENQRPATERYNRLMYFDANAANPINAQVAPLLGQNIKGAFEYANGSNRYAWPPDNTNFAPRMGIAYRITDKLVARAGAGIFYLPASAMISFDNPGQFYGFASQTPMIATTTGGFYPADLVSNPFPNGVNQPTGSSLGPLTLVGDGLGQIWIKQPHPTPYSEEWSFDLQYQIGAHSVIEAGYTGIRGKKLLYGNPNLDLDQLYPSFLSLGAQLDQQVANPFYGVAPSSSYLGSQPTIAYNELLRPYPQYTYLQATRSLPGAHSAFDALNVKYNHTWSAGLSLLTTYQWSKAMDNGPEDFLGWATGNQWRDSYHTNLDYNISTHDVPQSFATALVYELPYGKGKTWGSNAPAVVRQVLGNWQVSSSFRLASGLPLYQVFWSYSNHLNNYGFPGYQLADAIANPTTTGDPNHWIGASSFAPPPSQFSLGNVAQRYSQLRERAERNVDVSIAKTFAFTERFRAQFRGEAFNVFNYAQYNLSAFNSFPLCVSCGDFGDLNSQENHPRLLQFSLKLLF